MERAAFELLYSMETSWWYRGRASIVLAALRKYGNRIDSLLDYGAGSGGMIDSWKQIAHEVHGFEPDSESRAAAERRGYTALYGDDAEMSSRDYTAIAACDVLEHIKDDAAALNRIHASLRPHGVLVVTVPANMWLWSQHDVAHHHFRRYSRSSLTSALTSAGFDIAFISHWNMFLFPMAVIMRLLNKAGEGSLALPPAVDGVLYALIRLEAALMRLIPLPFGISLVAVAIRR